MPTWTTKRQSRPSQGQGPLQRLNKSGVEGVRIISSGLRQSLKACIHFQQTSQSRAHLQTCTILSHIMSSHGISSSKYRSQCLKQSRHSFLKALVPNPENITSRSNHRFILFIYTPGVRQRVFSCDCCTLLSFSLVHSREVSWYDSFCFCHICSLTSY